MEINITVVIRAYTKVKLAVLPTIKKTQTYNYVNHSKSRTKNNVAVKRKASKKQDEIVYARKNVQ